MTSLATRPYPQPQAAQAPSRARTRLLVVDDHPAVRTGLRELLSDEPDFDVVAAVPSAEAGLDVAERHPLDVAIVDYQLGGRNGLWLSRKLKRLPQPPAVVIYSGYADGLLAAAAVVAECDSIVSKGRLGSDLCDAVRTVASGRRRLPLLPPRLGESVRCRLDHEQQAIFGLLLAGVEPAEAASTLGLTGARLEAQLWEMLKLLEGPPE